MDAPGFAARFALALLCLLPLSTPHAAEAPPAAAPDADAFGTVPAVDEVALSPDGKQLAWVEPIAKGAAVVFYDLDAPVKKLSLTFDPTNKVRSLSWADNETLLITVSAFATFGSRQAADHYEMYRTYATDARTGKMRMLLMDEGARQLVTSARMLASRTAKPKTVIMSSWDFSVINVRQQTGTRLTVGRKNDGWISQIFEVDTRTGKGALLEAGTAFTQDWVINRNGEPVARSEWNPATSLFTVHARSSLGWKEIFREQGAGARDLYGLTSDETAIIISAVTTTGRDGLRKLPLDGSEITALLEDETEDVSGIVYDRVTRTPVGVTLGGAQQGVRWLDKDAETRFRRIAGAFKGKRVAVYGRSDDGKRMIAHVDGPSTPPVYYFVDLAKGTADIVGEAYPALVDARLGDVRSIQYKARDGADVPAYLTIPPGSEGKNLPLVVLPHGGPESRDDYAFDWWAQFLAVRGYAVLQPQFRGSTGFGEAWRLAGYRQWGGLMQDDLTDGVKAMIDQGIADGTRVCIVGGSYGGYAALAGAAFTPDLYRCAVSVNGVADLPRMLAYEREHAGAESDALAYWREHIGSGTDPNVTARSPLRAVAQIQAPVLLMHAVNDTTVPHAQSEVMARELERLKKKVTFISLAGEDHYLSQSGTRVQMLRELEKFLAEQLRKQ